MSIESTIARVAALTAAQANPAVLTEEPPTAATGGTEFPAEGASGTQSGSFASALQAAALEQSELPGQRGQAGAGGIASTSTSGLAALQAPGGAQIGSVSPSTGALTSAGAVGGAAAPGSGNVGARIVSIAESQAGQEEQPPGSGSNEGPAIAMYRSATKGSSPGAPWCAYFASWVARQAGEPLGNEGQGFGAVSDIWSWAQSAGRARPAGAGFVPKPGDLIVFGGEHVGIVRSVRPDGKINTIEGNYENKVALNVRSPNEPTGYVEMG
jgi:hypothetical protein